MHGLENILPTVYSAFYLILSILRIQEKIAKYNNSCRIFNVIIKKCGFCFVNSFCLLNRTSLWGESNLLFKRLKQFLKYIVKMFSIVDLLFKCPQNVIKLLWKCLKFVSKYFVKMCSIIYRRFIEYLNASQMSYLLWWIIRKREFMQLFCFVSEGHSVAIGNGTHAVRWWREIVNYSPNGSIIKVTFQTGMVWFGIWKISEKWYHNKSIGTKIIISHTCTNRVTYCLVFCPTSWSVWFYLHHPLSSLRYWQW